MTNQQHPALFDWATELLDAEGHVTLSAKEAHEIGARLRSMGEKLKAYEDLDKAASDVQLLRTGYAAARLEIESLQARIKTMAEEHADELMVAHLDGRMRAAQPAGAQQPGTAYAELPSYEHQRAIMEAERNASLDEYSRIVPLTSTESMIYERAFTNGWNRHASHGQAPAQAAPAAVAGPSDTFRGDTTCLVQSIIALLELDAEGALVPHGIGGHARALLYAAASRLAAPTAQTVAVRGAPADLPPLPDPDLRDVGTTPGGIKEFLRGYATEYAKAALASSAPADSALKDHQIAALVNELRDIAIQYYGTQQLRERIARAVIPALKAQATDSVPEDAARLDWLLLRISGAEFRRIGVHYSGNASRADVDAARKQGANHD